MPERGLETWTPKFVVTVDEAVARHDTRIEYMKRVLKENVHYGVIPGTGSKPTLLKPGAEALCADMGLRPDPIDDAPAVIDMDGRDHNGEPFIYYQRKVNLYAIHKVTGEKMWVGAGSGACTSWEDKYRWRTQVRTCPNCKQAAIIKGREEWGGGWVCFKKKGGCGAKFPDGAEVIEKQPLGRVANDRVADLANTILKMADKRALIAAVLNTTGVSDLFTQDVDDGSEMDDAERARMEASREVAPPIVQPKPSAPHPTNRRTPAAAPSPAAAGSPAPAPSALVWTEEQKNLVRARVKELQGERHPVLYKGWKDYMTKTGGWAGLYADQKHIPEAFDILGIPVVAAAIAEFSPDEVPA